MSRPPALTNSPVYAFLPAANRLRQHKGSDFDGVFGEARILPIRSTSHILPTTRKILPSFPSSTIGRDLSHVDAIKINNSLFFFFSFYLCFPPWNGNLFFLQETSSQIPLLLFPSVKTFPRLCAMVLVLPMSLRSLKRSSGLRNQENNIARPPAVTLSLAERGFNVI